MVPDGTKRRRRRRRRRGVLSLQCFLGISYTSQSARLSVGYREACVSCSPSLLSFHGDVTGINEHQGVQRRGHSQGWDGTVKRFFFFLAMFSCAQVYFLTLQVTDTLDFVIFNPVSPCNVYEFDILKKNWTLRAFFFQSNTKSLHFLSSHCLLGSLSNPNIYN